MLQFRYMRFFLCEVKASTFQTQLNTLTHRPIQFLLHFRILSFQLHLNQLTGHHRP